MIGWGSGEGKHRVVGRQPSYGETVTTATTAWVTELRDVLGAGRPPRPRRHGGLRP